MLIQTKILWKFAARKILVIVSFGISGKNICVCLIHLNM